MWVSQEIIVWLGVLQKNACSRDLRMSQNSKQSIWISVWKKFYKCFKGQKQELEGPISQLPQLPVERPLISKTNQACISSGRWSQARNGPKGKERLDRGKGKFCRYFSTKEWPFLLTHVSANAVDVCVHHMFINLFIVETIPYIRYRYIWLCSICRTSKMCIFFLPEKI